MGCKFSKKTENSHNLSSFEAAFGADPELRSLRLKLEQRTTGVITTLATGGQFQSLSLDSLREVPRYLLENDEEVVNAVLEHQKEIWDNPELSDLVKDYFETNRKTIALCDSLEKCLKRARDRHAIIQVALARFDEENTERSHGGKTSYSKTLLEFKNFKMAGDAFGDEVFSSFRSVYEQQWNLLQRLKVQKSKLDKKLKPVNAWRTVSNVLFGVTFVAVIIFSAVVMAPPAVIATASGTSALLGSAGKLLDSFWKNWVNVIKQQSGITSSMHVKTNRHAIKELESIGLLVDKLEQKMKSPSAAIDLGLEKEEGVMEVVNELRNKIDVIMPELDALIERAANYRQDIR